MAWKKTFKLIARQKAQSVLEYFILFSIVTLLTMVSLSSFATRGEDFFKKAAGKIIAEP